MQFYEWNNSPEYRYKNICFSVKHNLEFIFFVSNLVLTHFSRYSQFKQEAATGGVL